MLFIKQNFRKQEKCIYQHSNQEKKFILLLLT